MRPLKSVLRPASHALVGQALGFVRLIGRHPDEAHPRAQFEFQVDVPVFSGRAEQPGQVGRGLAELAQKDE